uniref:Uncharacterized protein n=1 Tax=Anguilla anguilla TaxID=7936 RepID=A0A0E9Q2T2_ANGAN
MFSKFFLSNHFANKSLPQYCALCRPTSFFFHRSLFLPQMSSWELLAQADYRPPGRLRKS